MRFGTRGSGQGLRGVLLAEGEEPDPRFSLANERTFLAWIRTALGVMAAGVVLHAVRGDDGSRLQSAFALVAVGAGAAIAVAAWTRWLAIENSLRQGRPLPLPVLGLSLTGFVVLAGAGMLVLAGAS